jgi:hypothetical protein
MKTLAKSFELIAESQLKHNTIYTDYKAEAMAYNLMKYYADIDQVFLKRLGNNNRSFHKDVESISSQVYELEERIVSISSYREGIYDYLPESLFHPPSLGKYNGRIDDIVAKMQKQKKIELNARKFFQPFELETFYLELNAIAKENEFEIIGDTGLLLEIVKELWPLLGALDTGTAKVFIYLLPVFHTVRADKSWFEKCLMAFLQIPVRITFEPNRIHDIEETSNALVLSKIKLGISTVLSGSHLDGERNWAVHFGPIPYEALSKYIPGSNLRKLLTILYNHCLPATVVVEEYFVTEKSTGSFVISKDEDTSRLGFSTFL